MKILVCITHVPDTTSKINFVDGNTKFDTTGVQFIIGPYDDYALARAIELKESHAATVTVINVGGVETEPTIRKALAIGADDAIRVNADPSDSYFVAYQIAEQAKAGGYDLILTGRESIDFNGGVVHSLVGELMGWPSLSPVMKLELEGTKAILSREIEGGKGREQIPLGVVEDGPAVTAGTDCGKNAFQQQLDRLGLAAAALANNTEVLRPAAHGQLAPQHFAL